MNKVGTKKTSDRPDYQDDNYIALANHIALVAEAIASGTIVGPYHAAIAGLQSNIRTLAAWTPDDRS